MQKPDIASELIHKRNTRDGCAFNPLDPNPSGVLPTTVSTT